MTTTTTLALYVHELGKEELNRRLRKGKRIVGKFLARGTMSEFVKLDENLPDNTSVWIFPKSVHGEPLVKFRGHWNQKLQRVL